MDFENIEKKKEEEKKEKKDDENKENIKEKEENEKEKKKETTKKDKAKKEDKKEEKKDEGKKEKKKKVYKDFFLYFIETHSGDSSLNITLEENKHANEFEKIKEEPIDYLENFNYTINRLKIIPSSGMKSLKLKFKLNSSDGNEFVADIELTEFSHDFFLYDFEYSIPEQKPKKKNKTYGCNLSHLQQFKLYLDYIDEVGFEKKSSAIENLVLSTKKLLILTYIKKEKDKDKEIEKVKEYYDLSLYFSVINACYENQIISELLYEFKLNIFDIEKKQSNLSNIEIENMRNTFNKLEKDPEIVLKYFKNEGEKVKPKAHLFFIIICFRLAFDSQNLLGSLNNILMIEDTQERIYKGIVKNNELFLYIPFTKEQISKMIKFSDSYNGIKRSLRFIITITDLMEIISEHFTHIIKLKKEEEKEKGKKHGEIIFEIDVVLAKETDNIKKASVLYENILDMQSKEKIDKFVVLGTKLIEKYKTYFMNKNLESLVDLKNLVSKIIKKIQSKSKSNNKQKSTDIEKYRKIEKELKTIIHNTGINLSSENKLTNIQILDFIIEDEDYLINNKEKIEETLKIFEGIKLSLINDDFIRKWRTIDWEKIFGEEEEKIYTKINDNAKDFQDFDNLMKLLNISEIESEVKFSPQHIKMMQDKFIKIFDNQNKKEEDNFRNNLVKLIFQSDSYEKKWKK